LVPEEPNKENRLCVSNIDLKDDDAVHAGWAVEMMVESKRTRSNRTGSSEPFLFHAAVVVSKLRSA
jgi:hypothetical protein